MRLLWLLAALLICALAADAEPHVAKVENGGLLFTDNPAGVSGVDAGYSIPMGESTLWLFGDVFLLDASSPARRYVGGVSNCALIAPSGKGRAPLARYRFLTDERGLARQVIPNGPGEGNETRLWPGGGWYNSANRRAYLYYAIIKTTGKGPFDFRQEGLGLARADASDPAKLVFERIKAPDGAWAWWRTEAGPVIGWAVVSGNTGPYLYIAGVRERGGHKTGVLARVPKGQLEKLTAYDYYTGDGPRWSRNLSDAADVAGLEDFPTELSISWNAYLGGYLAVQQVAVGEKLHVSLAPEPWGPYRQIGEIGAPHRAFEQAFCYAGKEHPELAEEGGRVIYITYVDSQRYWLQLLKVTVAK